MKRDEMHFDTLAVRAGLEIPDPATGSVAPPLYQTTNYAVSNVDEGAERCIDLSKGYIYTRLWNPTQKALEEKVAALEGGEMAFAAASGMGAIITFFMEILRAGDHIIADQTSYSATQTFFAEIIPKFQVEVSFIDTNDLEWLENTIQANTKVIYFETPANPTIKVVDISAVSQVAHKHGVMSVVDNTYASPYSQRPLELGADVVIESATKFMGGHGDVQGGLVIGKRDLIMRIREGTLKNMGAIIDPFAAWLLLRGLKTLSVRMERHSLNGMAVACFLESHPKVERVYYPGLPSHPQHEIAKRQMSSFGGMIAFEIRGGLEGGKALLNHVQLCRLAVSLGDADTLIEHAASMTHVLIPEEERRKAGITNGLIRLSVGIEDCRDIIADLEQAFTFVKV